MGIKHDKWYAPCYDCNSTDSHKHLVYANHAIWACNHCGSPMSDIFILWPY